MPIVSKTNDLLAEFAIFPVEPALQDKLVERAIANIGSNLQSNPGFTAGTVLRSRDRLRVTSYVQWANRESYITTQPFTEFEIPDVHLFEIFASEPEQSELNLSHNHGGTN